MLLYANVSSCILYAQKPWETRAVDARRSFLFALDSFFEGMIILPRKSLLLEHSLAKIDGSDKANTMNICDLTSLAYMVVLKPILKLNNKPYIPTESYEAAIIFI